MANIQEENTWTNGIYQLEEDDVVQGGPAGIDNLQARQLANRTQYLKTLCASLGSEKQQLNNVLTALSALTIVADRIIYSTSNESFSTTTLSAFMRTLLDDIDAATARVTLGLGNASTLSVGTSAGTVAAGDHAHNNLQPLDATLSALSMISTAADRLIYSTGQDTFSTTPLSAFMRTLLDDIDAESARKTLGIDVVYVNNINSIDSGVRFFSFNESAIGAPTGLGSYDAIGWQISNNDQVSQFVDIGWMVLHRSDDKTGSGFSDWNRLTNQSGVYTPSISGSPVNISSFAFFDTEWTRVNNWVTISMVVSIKASAIGSCSMTFNLPPSAPTAGDYRDINGQMITDDAGRDIGVVVGAGENKAKINFTATNTNSLNRFITLRYKAT